MATPRQISANQRNALRSTGPRSLAGKGRSQFNAVTQHHALGKTVAGNVARLRGPHRRHGRLMRDHIVSHVLVKISLECRAMAMASLHSMRKRP